MPKYENITEWECDRCGAKTFATPGDGTEKSWGQPTRTLADGSSSTSTLCPGCLADYKLIAAAHDKEMTEWTKGEK